MEGIAQNIGFFRAPDARNDIRDLTAGINRTKDTIFLYDEILCRISEKKLDSLGIAGNFLYGFKDVL